MTLPTVELPTVEFPTVESPTVELAATLPTAELPTTLPTVELPTTLPTAELPTAPEGIPTDGLLCNGMACTLQLFPNSLRSSVSRCGMACTLQLRCDEDCAEDFPQTTTAPSLPTDLVFLGGRSTGSEKPTQAQSHNTNEQPQAALGQETAVSAGASKRPYQTAEQDA